MKYKDPVTGELKQLSVKAADTLPIGTIVDYDGETVPEGWEEYGTDDYSTEETFTGKHWIDGKPIYRKVLVNTIKKSGSNVFSLNSVGLNNIEKYITLKSISNGDPINEDYYTNDSDLLRTLINYNGLHIQLGSSYPSVPCLVYTIIEYTKTTD